MSDADQTKSQHRATIVRASVGGVLMGLANLVPGISGGTMLLASGVYTQFISAIAEVSTLRFRPRSLLTLACIIGAALLAIGLLAGPVSQLVIHHRWVMYSLFIGLTLGGAPLLWQMLRPISSSAIAMCILGIALMGVMAVAKPGAMPAEAGARAYLMFGLAGLAAASAMVLPGVSGGYLLLILGQYVAVLGAVDTLKDGLSHGDMTLIGDAMHVVIPLGIGVILGVVGVSNLLKVALEKFEKATLGLLLGLLLGSVLGLWPFQAGVAPELGAAFRGDVVGRVDGALVMLSTGKAIEPADYETAFFTPSVWQALGALGLIVAGFIAATLVSHIGRETKGQSTDPTD